MILKGRAAHCVSLKMADILALSELLSGLKDGQDEVHWLY